MAVTSCHSTDVNQKLAMCQAGTVIEAGDTRMVPNSLSFLHPGGRTDHKQGNPLIRSFLMGVNALTKQMNIIGEVREAFRWGITKTW